MRIKGDNASFLSCAANAGHLDKVAIALREELEDLCRTGRSIMTSAVCRVKPIDEIEHVFSVLCAAAHRRTAYCQNALRGNTSCRIRGHQNRTALSGYFDSDL